jgi:hypothetical protein
MPSNDYIINQMRAEALRFYGMGEAAERVERVAVAAVVVSLTMTVVTVDVINPRASDPEKFKRCEFLRSEAIVQMYNANSGLIRLPKAYLPAFCLWKFELKGRLLGVYEEHVARHNAPYLKSTSAKTEKIGNMRI